MAEARDWRDDRKKWLCIQVLLYWEKNKHVKETPYSDTVYTKEQVSLL